MLLPVSAISKKGKIRDRKCIGGCLGLRVGGDWLHVNPADFWVRAVA